MSDGLSYSFQKGLPCVCLISKVVMKGSFFIIAINILVIHVFPNPSCINLPAFNLLPKCCCHLLVYKSSICCRLILFCKNSLMASAASLLLCKAMLIPLPHKGVITPAASPHNNTWFSTCDFFAKDICEIVMGASNNRVAFSKIFFKCLFLKSSFF